MGMIYLATDGDVLLGGGPTVRARVHRRSCRAIPIEPGRGTVTGRGGCWRRQVVHVADVLSDPEYHVGPRRARLGGYRAMLGVPMLREGVPIGVFAMRRIEAGPFTDKQIELVADLRRPGGDRHRERAAVRGGAGSHRELSRSLEELRTAQDRLVQTEKLASLGQLTAGIAHEIKNPLNFVNNFSALSGELIDELREALAGAPRRRKAARRDRRADRHAEGQSRKGRAARQARRFDRQEHAAALARRAPASTGRSTSTPSSRRA